MKYNYRFIARITIEAETPIAVGGGSKGFTDDRVVALDANRLPYIPGTSLSGVLRHAIFNHAAENNLKEDPLKDIFGYQNPNKQEDSLGSRLAVSSAHLIGKEGKVYDGLFIIPEDGFIENFKKLPLRQHVRISHRGGADTENKGLFNENVLFKGSRLKFELELKGTSDTFDEDKEKWDLMLNLFNHPDFRIGSGSTKGFGQIRVEEILSKTLNLEDSKKPEDRDFYINHSTSLDTFFDGDKITPASNSRSKYITYQLNIVPNDFYLFGSAKQVNGTDKNPVTEQIIEWKKPEVSEGMSEEDKQLVLIKPQIPEFIKQERVLIPATSVKGAISHRLAYHYNVLYNSDKSDENKIFADRIPIGKTIKDYVGKNNPAVRSLFGFASDYSSDEPGQKGAVVIIDLFKVTNKRKKLDHVAIDRFTGGPIGTALFGESVVHYENDWRSGNSAAIATALQKKEFGTAKNLLKRELSSDTDKDALKSQINKIDNQILCLEIRVKKEIVLSDPETNSDLLNEAETKAGSEKAKMKANIKMAFEHTLEDLCNGNLPLGGNTMRGAGGRMGGEGGILDEDGLFTGLWKII